MGIIDDYNMVDIGPKKDKASMSLKMMKLNEKIFPGVNS